jgi:hypothetical protein
MTAPGIPLGVALHGAVEDRPDRPLRYRARVRWTDPPSGKRRSKSEAFAAEGPALAWLDQMQRLAMGGVHPDTATMTSAEYGGAVMPLALRGLEAKTLDPYLSGWRRRVLPSLGHLAPRMITNGAVDRAVDSWIADECSRSTIKNSLAVLVRVMDQAVRDGILERNPARITGWQHPVPQGRGRARRSPLARTTRLGNTHAPGGCARRTLRRPTSWLGRRNGLRRLYRGTHRRGLRLSHRRHRHHELAVDRPTTDHPSPGGLVDKGTTGKRARVVPLIADVRELVQRRIDSANAALSPACSPAPAEVASPPRSSATRPTGTRS